MRLLGNDVVDLADPETRISCLHHRFEERVFTASERAALAASPSPHVLHWALWAGKESAYKALKRREPDLVFVPGEFDVELAMPAAATSGRAGGQVTHQGRTLALDLRVDDSYVHAIARDRDTPAADILAGVEQTGEDASTTVRQAAMKAIAATLRVDLDSLRICGRPPVVWQRERPLDTIVSLSHHGRFVAFAVAPRASVSSARRDAAGITCWGRRPSCE